MKAQFTAQYRDIDLITIECALGQPSEQPGAVGLNIGSNPPGTRFTYLTPSEARQVGHLLLAAAEESERLQSKLANKA